MHSTLAAVSPFLNGWLIAVGFFGFIFLAFLSGLGRAIQSTRWPRTTGKVVESTVRESSGTDDSTTFAPMVRYTYVVEGKTLESKQVAIGAVSGSQSGAEAVVEKYPLGAEVTVYHHPKLHYLAVLEPGHWALPAVATAISGLVLYAMVAVWISKSLHPKQGPWDKSRAKAAAQRAALASPTPAAP